MSSRPQQFVKQVKTLFRFDKEHQLRRMIAARFVDAKNDREATQAWEDEGGTLTGKASARKDLGP